MLCREEQKTVLLVLTDKSAQVACSCTTQVLETNPQSGRERRLLNVMVFQAGGLPSVALYPIITQLYFLLDYFVDTVDSYGHFY